MEEVKKILLERVEELLDQVFKDIENDIIDRSEKIDRRHKEICKYVLKVIKSAEEVQEMDKFINNLTLEKSVMLDKIDDWRSNLFLLINMDYNISERTQDLAKIIYGWPKKLDIVLDDADTQHYEEREALEQQMFKNRQKFEKEMETFEEEIKEVETYEDLFSYPNNVIPIKKFQERLDIMKDRKDRLEIEENILIGFKSPYESYFRVEKFFEPHYKFWTVAEQFLDKKKFWKSSVASKLNIEEVIKVKLIAQDMLRKVKNKLGPDQTKLIKGMHNQVKNLDSCMFIIETLSNPGLKQRHWEEINKVSGSELDFKKLSIDRIKFLKIETMIEPIAKISDIASKEYSIELFLKTMEDEINTYKEKLFDLKTYSVDEIEELKKFKVTLFA